MSVFVDTMKAPLGRMIMCHMIADSHEELISMVKRIGVNPKWIQKKNTPYEHFDISKAKKEMAISFGAIEITQKELAQKIKDRKL